MEPAPETISLITSESWPLRSASLPVTVNDSVDHGMSKGEGVHRTPAQLPLGYQPSSTPLTYLPSLPGQSSIWASTHATSNPSAPLLPLGLPIPPQLRQSPSVANPAALRHSRNSSRASNNSFPDTWSAYTATPAQQHVRAAVAMERTNSVGSQVQSLQRTDSEPRPVRSSPRAPFGHNHNASDISLDTLMDGQMLQGLGTGPWNKGSVSIHGHTSALTGGSGLSSAIASPTSWQAG